MLQGAQRQARIPAIPTHEFRQPHRRLGVSKAELHLQDILGAQSQMGTEKGHEDRVVPVILQGKRMLGEGLLFPSSPFSENQSLPHSSP